MKQVINDLFILLSTNALLLSDSTTNIKVNSFRKYADPLITLYPALLLVRKNKSNQIKTVNLGYLNSYVIDILLMTQDFEETTDCLKGLDDLDKLVENVEEILQKNPKINGNYFDSNVTGISYNSFVVDNYINFTAIATVEIKKKKQYN